MHFLPFDILALLISYLDSPSLKQLALTGKFFSSQDLWKRLLRRRWPYLLSWRRLYLPEEPRLLYISLVSAYWLTTNGKPRLVTSSFELVKALIIAHLVLLGDLQVERYNGSSLPRGNYEFHQSLGTIWPGLNHHRHFVIGSLKRMVTTPTVSRLLEQGLKLGQEYFQGEISWRQLPSLRF
jgi:hypothetical protein